MLFMVTREPVAQVLSAVITAERLKQTLVIRKVLEVDVPELSAKASLRSPVKTLEAIKALRLVAHHIHGRPLEVVVA